MGKHISVIFVLIATGMMLYGLVLVCFGLPVVNGDITKGARYVNIAEASPSIANIYRIYIYAWIVTMAAGATGITLTCLQGWFFRSITSKKKAVVVVIITQGVFLVCVLAIVSSLTMTLCNYVAYRIAESEVLRELARAYAVRYTGSTILFIIFSFYLAKEAIYFRLRNTDRICSDHYIRAYLKAIDNEDIDDAKQAIEKACDICPTSVRAWSFRSQFAYIHLSNQRDAALFLERAKGILSQGYSVSKEDESCYEFCLGIFLLSREKYQESIEHIRKSLDLVYNKERAEYLEKVKRNINEMVA